MKKAYLVDFLITTRVIVDGSDMAHNIIDNDVVDKALELAKARLLENPHEYIIDDNFTEVTEDTGLPYDPASDEPCEDCGGDNE